MARGLRGVRNDLSELGRHLVDIACFLHPLLSPASFTDSPPSTPRRSPSPAPRPPPPSRLIAGILSDLAELSGTLRGGLSRFSSALRGPAEWDGAAAPDAREAEPGDLGLSDEVVEFVRDLANLPESFLDFPLPAEDDFDMSHIQREHIAAVERLVPDLADLRIRLCPSYMSEDSFWKVYFTLLHPQLNEHDSELLLSHQVADSVHVIMNDMQSRPDSQAPNSETESSSGMTSRENIVRQENDQSSDAQPLAKTTSEQSIGQWSEIRSSKAQPLTKTTSEQSIGQWSEIPSDVDVLSEIRRLHSTDDLSCSENVGENIVVMEEYMDSLLGEETQVHSLSSSIRRDALRRKPASSSGDYNSSAQRLPQAKVISSEGSGSWRAGGDSDFELL
uniref:BSD domain-containing protein n=1 Tax=Ananas comosus var. bracteatus TaxID=296719 RepID=A0A6V7P556_ANACO|nr:unnamed protein product [Ananas comosus var. bracteatus]